METYNNQLIGLASAEARSEFYRKTYMHVAVAVLAFIVVESLLLMFIPTSWIVAMFSGKFIWLAIIGLFWLASMLCDRLVFAQSKSTQYLGLGLYVIIEALIFMPLIFVALSYADGGSLLQQAAIVTIAMFLGLTAMVFVTNADFSFLRTILVIGGFVSLGLIAAGAMFGFNLGLWFSVGMVVLASGSIIYQTSQLKNVYSTEQYVGASLQIFASVMLLFWYILRIFLSRRN